MRALLAVVLLTGCQATAPAADHRGPSLEDTCLEMRRRAAECLGVPDELAALYLDCTSLTEGNACEVARENEDYLRRIGIGVNGPRFDRDKLAECVVGIRGLTCEQLEDGDAPWACSMVCRP